MQVNRPRSERKLTEKSELDGSCAKFLHRVTFLEARVGGDSNSTTRAMRAAGSESRLNDMTVGK